MLATTPVATPSLAKTNTCAEALELWPSNVRAQAMAIMFAESGGRSNALGRNTNGTFDSGCWQVNSIHAWRVGGDLNSLMNPVINQKTAFAIYSERGWCAWSTARKLGLCRN